MNTWPLQSNCFKFYGDPRAGKVYNTAWAAINIVHVLCPWAMYIEKKAVPYIQIHRLCADSLRLVLADVWNACGKSQDKIKALGYDVYDGSFNYRPMRESTKPSMHMFACAIDFDATDNPFRSKKHRFTAASPIVQAFKREGWTWGGDWNSPDAMHFQAARVD